MLNVKDKSKWRRLMSLYTWFQIIVQHYNPEPWKHWDSVSISAWDLQFEFQPVLHDIGISDMGTLYWEYPDPPLLLIYHAKPIFDWKSKEQSLTLIAGTMEGFDQFWFFMLIKIILSNIHGLNKSDKTLTLKKAGGGVLCARSSGDHLPFLAGSC